MTKTEKVNFVIKTLNNLYPSIPVPLDHKDPYTLLIAVLLSAQCTDVRVNQITPLLFAKADNPYDMIKMTVEEIKAIIRPCGLSPMKSKGITFRINVFIFICFKMKMLNFLLNTLTICFTRPYTIVMPTFIKQW